jgi:ketosteroid isomerase-like protein
MIRFGLFLWSLSLLLSVSAGAQAGRSGVVARAPRSRAVNVLTGVYRIDVANSDRLYSVVAGASSSLPFAEQQRFFIDLTIRLTPPDQLAIERRGDLVHLASSRAPRTSFMADGREQLEHTAVGNTRVRALIDGDDLVISSRSDAGETYKVTFSPADGGRRLLVTRHIGTKELNHPVVIRSVYNKISDVAQWAIYGEPETETASARPVINSVTNDSSAAGEEQGAADSLRAALDEWVAATNARDIRRQMTFYVPTLQAFYLRRNFPKEGVRAEKERVFARARSIDISAEEPEILFLDAGGVAVMRFRKRYAIEGGAESRRGEVVQELRWQRTADGWKIFSERDVRVIR